MTKAPFKPELFDIYDDNLSEVMQPDFSDQEGVKETSESNFSLIGIFGIAMGLLISLMGFGFSFWLRDLYQNAQAAHQWLGYTVLVLSLCLMGLLCFLVFKEIFGLLRIKSNIKLKNTLLKAQQKDDIIAVKKAVTRLIPLAADEQAFNHQLQQQLDVKSVMELTEVALLKPLDQRAEKLIQSAAHQVAVSTALSKIPMLDMLIVFFINWRLIRSLCKLYGMRPSNLGLWKLFVHIVSHLMVTGGIALSEDVISSILGHNLTAKLSSRLGEGMINGMLTCRIGLKALDFCRPLAYQYQTKPSLKNIVQIFFTSKKI